MIFSRKKIEKPKSPLGTVLFHYDEIADGQLKKIIETLFSKKIINVRRYSNLLNDYTDRLKFYSEEISKDNLKTDYRSDKARDIMLEMIERCLKIIETIKNINLKNSADSISSIKEDISFSKNKREIIRYKLKDLEYDYI